MFKSLWVKPLSQKMPSHVLQCPDWNFPLKVIDLKAALPPFPLPLQRHRKSSLTVSGSLEAAGNVVYLDFPHQLPLGPAKHCCLFVLFASTVESKTWECWDRGGVDGAIMAVRPKPELLQADVVQQKALNTITPPCAIRCVCTNATICAAVPNCSSPLSRRVPQLPFWRSGLTGALWSAKTSKTSVFFKRGASVHFDTVRQYLTSGVLYS